MNTTVISRVLDLLQQLLPSGAALPENFILAADNTPRESKNQIMLSFLAYLVSSGRFATTELQFLQVGHTHNELDQRFSTIATVLSRSPTLEDPEEFAHTIRQHIVPPRNRTLMVELLDSTFDFQSWFATFDSAISGLTATHTQTETNHVWRCVPRSLLPLIGKDLDVATTREDWALAAESDADVVLLLKEFMHSDVLSQQPLLLLPHSLGESLLPANLKIMHRNWMKEKAVQQFLKTAKAVAQDPWKLFKAQAWLEEWVARNVSKQCGEAPFKLFFVFGHSILPLSDRSFAPWFEMMSFERKAPREVVVAKAAKKRPASAGPSARQVCKRPAAAGSPVAAVADEQAEAEEEALEPHPVPIAEVHLINYYLLNKIFPVFIFF